MQSVKTKLRQIRTIKKMKQAEVAAKLNCATASVTNWENEKSSVKPSLATLSELCNIYGISPLSLLDHEYSYSEIAAIAEKPYEQREYDEHIALNFSGYILADHLPKAISQEAEKHEEEALAFAEQADLMVRFEGHIEEETVSAVKSAYEQNRELNEDVIFALAGLNKTGKAAVIGLLYGLLHSPGNIDPLCDRIYAAQSVTADRLLKHLDE